jgi:DNA repair protein RecO (recombination protein O)
MPLYKTQGIILKTQILKEFDKIIILHTPLGKFEAVAKGVRKITSHVAGKLEPFNEVRLVVAQGRQLDTITQVEVLNYHSGIKLDLERLAQGLFVLSLFHSFIFSAPIAPKSYYLLKSSLQELEGHKPHDLFLALVGLKILSLSGFLPQLSACSVCKIPLASPGYFSFTTGGVLCPSCLKEDKNYIILKHNIINLMGFLARTNYAGMRRIKAGIEAGALKLFIKQYLEYILERPLYYLDTGRQI